jgi:hypothetical protein
MTEYYCKSSRAYAELWCRARPLKIANSRLSKLHLRGTIPISAPSHTHFLDSHLVPTPLRHSVKGPTRRDISEFSTSSFELQSAAHFFDCHLRKNSATQLRQSHDVNMISPFPHQVQARLIHGCSHQIYNVLAVVGDLTVSSRSVERRSK